MYNSLALYIGGLNQNISSLFQNLWPVLPMEPVWNNVVKVTSQSHIFHLLSDLFVNTEINIKYCHFRVISHHILSLNRQKLTFSRIKIWLGVPSMKQKEINYIAVNKYVRYLTDIKSGSKIWSRDIIVKLSLVSVYNFIGKWARHSVTR